MNRDEILGQMTEDEKTWLVVARPATKAETEKGIGIEEYAKENGIPIYELEAAVNHYWILGLI